MTLVDRTGIEVIDRDGCLELLAEDVIGRVAVLEGGSPLILPVNYALDGDTIVFRTAPGSKLDAAHGSAACFEIDGFDRATRSGWSVVVRGRLHEVTTYDAALFERTKDLADPWLDGDRPHVVRLSPRSISGRRGRPKPTGSTTSTLTEAVADPASATPAPADAGSA